jgi:hypothetical protein
VKQGHFALAVLLVIVAQASGVRAEWRVAVLGGSAYNVRTPLTVHQSGHADVRFTARYETRAFEAPLYWDVRVATWSGECAWELELIHHKLYLDNNPPDIQQFSITHGCNLLIASWARRHGSFVLRVGGGVVIAHPESTVRGVKHREDRGFLGMGYYFAGPTVQGAVEKRVAIGGRFFAAFEGKLTVTRCRVPVGGGNADLVNVAFHGLVGLGCSL